MSAPRWLGARAGKNASNLGGSISVDDPERNRELFKIDSAVGCAVPDELRCTYTRAAKTTGPTDPGGRCGCLRFKSSTFCALHLSPEERDWLRALEIEQRHKIALEKQRAVTERLKQLKKLERWAHELQMFCKIEQLLPFMPQKDVAKELGVSQGTISRIKRKGEEGAYRRPPGL